MNFYILKKTTPLIVLLLLFKSSFSQKSIDLQFDYCQFQTQKQAFIETYISIDGSSTSYQINENGLFQSQVNIRIEFFKNNESVVADKYSLVSPEVKDTTTIDFVFIDQQRYFLNDGDYTLHLVIESPYQKNQTLSYQKEINVQKKELGISDIQFIQNYSETTEINILSKNGYDLVPFVSNYYNSNNKKLNYYFEYYKSHHEDDLIQVKIISHEKQELVGNLALNKKTKSNTTPILASFSLEDLPTGSYFLEINALNQKNQIISSKKRLFYNINQEIKIDDIDINTTFASKINHIDTLKRFIQYLYPIQSRSESIYADNLLNYNDLEMMQKYFYKFWKDRNSLNAEEAWQIYLSKVYETNNTFGNGLKEGFLTDRGRVYLSYGLPNSRTQEVLPNEFHPFEVWHYHQIDQERNIKFIFSNKNMPNDYRLVYSNKQGEVSNTDWLDRFEENYYDQRENGTQSPIDFFNNPQ